MDFDMSPFYAVALFVLCSSMGTILSLTQMVTSKDILARIAWLINMLFFAAPWIYMVWTQ